MEEQSLRDKLHRTQQQSEVYRAELDLFRAFLKRNPLPEGVLEAEQESKSRRGRRGTRHKTPKSRPSLSVNQKVKIAEDELDHIKKEQEEAATNAEKLIDSLRAVLEETDIRIAELKKEAYEFKRDIVVGAENVRTGKTMAEKVVRYMEDKLRQKDAVVEKLRLKNGALKSQISKVESQLTQKEEMGDVLHYIDFHQQEIENKQYVGTIEQRNRELLNLKKTTGRTVQVLNGLKKRLADLMSESEWLHSEIKGRTELLGKITTEHERVQRAAAQLNSANTGLQQQHEDTAGMPEVRDFITQKATLYELQNAVKNWERKVEIASIAMKRTRTLDRRAMDQYQ